MFFGDFWQMDPTGYKSFMSNPFEKAEDSRGNVIVSMVWSTSPGDEMKNHHLQPWQGDSRVLELNTNIRSGADEWFSEVLDECRRGALSEVNYRFLHGLKTNAPIRFWYAFKDATVKPHDRQPCDMQHRCDACRKRYIVETVYCMRTPTRRKQLANSQTRASRIVCLSLLTTKRCSNLPSIVHRTSP